SPLQAPFSLDGGWSQKLSRFYQLSQQHHRFYLDRSRTLYPVPYFVLPSKNNDCYPLPLDLPPLSASTHWCLMRNLCSSQPFPMGQRVPSQVRGNQDSF
ncbi:CB070 protein, partial [Rhinopomastus cyanomelas]|nr:CB070 protein [Rhinopomastus cyanomelas]